MLKEQIVNTLKESATEETQDTKLISDSLTRGKFGDYSSNLLLRLNRGLSSIDIEQSAKKIVSNLEKSGLFEKVEFAKPGFLNLYLKEKVFQKELQKIIEKREDYFSVETNKGKKARVEFVSANPTGPLHIGNARGGPIGDSLAAVLEKSGYQVLREYLHNDIGTQVENLGQSLINLKKGENLEDQEYKGEYLLDLIKEIPNEVKTGTEVGSWAVEVLLKEIIKEIEQIGIKYNKVYKESDFSSGATREVIEKLKKLKLLKEKEGATWFAPNDEYLKDRETVVIRSGGRPTYFANDIAYHNLKFSEGYDLVIDELGSGHDGHIPKLKAAIEALGYDLEKFKVIVHQNVRVKRAGEVIKMSKRAGNFITASEVINEVGKDAFRFFILQRAPETHMDFDLDLAKKRSLDNPVYYVQYAHARMCSILKKASFKSSGNFDSSLLKEDAEIALIKKLTQLPELIEAIAENFAVQNLASYSLELADEFHSFYEKVQVINEDAGLTAARLNLIEAARITLEQNLSLLGVSAPERM